MILAAVACFAAVALTRFTIHLIDPRGSSDGE